MKPFIVFHATKRESNSLDEEFESRCVVKSSGNAWMNEELITVWVKRVLGAFFVQQATFSLGFLRMSYDWQLEKRFEGGEYRQRDHSRWVGISHLKRG